MKTLTVNCPTCSEPAQWSSENSFRPFCSERCRLIDLGQWADGSYHVPGEIIAIEETGDDTG
ncbi:MAG: hypothetical protein FD165_2417 [Gammaproteobacteria bacterium]|nr:MAG: hypothetical protein FD165_2417 [Gammaproteobacteria bacterium]TND03669.1 MAG: hypothetical protein FD120_1825 [Gammaproteobacteria bacterium]